MRSERLLVYSLSAILAVIGSGKGAELLRQSDLFVGGKDGYHTYRIPSLIVTKKDTVLAFCEGRKNSGSDTGDIDLLMKRSWDGGKNWSQQRVIWDDGTN